LLTIIIVTDVYPGTYSATGGCKMADCLVLHIISSPHMHMLQLNQREVNGNLSVLQMRKGPPWREASGNDSPGHDALKAPRSDAEIKKNAWQC
jgi:hypothetical protein